MTQEFVVYCYTSDAPRVILFDICLPSDVSTPLYLVRVTSTQQAELFQNIFYRETLERTLAQDVASSIASSLKQEIRLLSFEELVAKVEQATGLTVEVVEVVS